MPRTARSSVPRTRALPAVTVAVTSVTSVVAAALLGAAPASAAGAPADPGRPLARHAPLVKILRRGPTGSTPGTSGRKALTRLTVGSGKAAPPRSQWIVTYDGFTPEAKASFQRAVDIWAGIVASPVPIRVSATFSDLGGQGVLGQAGPYDFFRRGSTLYPSALMNALSGKDVDTSAPDIEAEFSSTEPGIYYGSGTTPGDEVDFETVVLHELGHGLGFFGSMDVTASGEGVYGYQLTDGGATYPVVYDRFASGAVAAGSPSKPLLSYANSSAALGNALVSDTVTWTGSHGVAGGNGAAPQLYDPAHWDASSSYSHLDDHAYPEGDPNSLLTPSVGDGEEIHDPGPIPVGMFQDMGWNAVRVGAHLDLPGVHTGGATVVKRGFTAAAKTASTAFGNRSDIGLSGDFDGDGVADLAVYRPGNATFYLRSSSTGAVREIRFGNRGDQPLVGDFNGDGTDTIGVRRPGDGTFYLTGVRADQPVTTIGYGNRGTGDVPLVADFDGDGKDTIGVYRRGTGTFYLTATRFGQDGAPLKYGNSRGDRPVVGDWDGDGTATIGVVRGTTWYLTSDDRGSAPPFTFSGSGSGQLFGVGLTR